MLRKEKIITEHGARILARVRHACMRMRCSPSFSSSFSQLFARSAHGPFQLVCYVPGYVHIITPVYTRKFSSTCRSDNHFCRAAEGLLRRDRRGGARNEPRFRAIASICRRTLTKVSTPRTISPFASPFSHFIHRVFLSYAGNVALLPSFLIPRSIAPIDSVK